ncbi:MAG: hypothetical protein AB1428_01120 [Bacteroidota bacterium]
MRTHLISMSFVAVCIVGLLMALPTTAEAQKKSKDITAASQQAPARSVGSLRDVLVKLQGQQTNIGVLTKVAGDYLIFENEGDTLMFPINTVQVVKLLKAEEGEGRKIEIRFLARD